MLAILARMPNHRDGEAGVVSCLRKSPAPSKTILGRVWRAHVSTRWEMTAPAYAQMIAVGSPDWESWQNAVLACGELLTHLFRGVVCVRDSTGG